MNAPRAEMEFLKEAIKKKEEDLKCPICLETAKPPIFMCPDSHIICSECAPKVQTCPQCRVRLPTPLKRHPFAEKIAMYLDDQLQRLAELTGRDPEPEQGPRLVPLSAPQTTFKLDVQAGRSSVQAGRWTFSNCSLLHKLLITGQGEQVVSRRGELNRELLSSTCEYKNYYGTPISKVTPLHLAALFESSATVVSTLIQAGGNVDALDSFQRSPLHLASMENPAVVPVLIGGGCKVNLLDYCQSSPLYCAARERRDRSAVAALMSAAPDPHLGNSPLTSPGVSDEMKDYIRSLSK